MGWEVVYIKTIYIKATYKSGRVHYFTINNFDNFRSAMNHMLKCKWNIFDHFVINIDEVETFEETTADKQIIS
ncbi:hypothetical protein [Paenibacillus naphthalenovorans]|nr:hypothetical protein [Paenibacillus naphthalenovorans]